MCQPVVSVVIEVSFLNTRHSLLPAILSNFPSHDGKPEGGNDDKSVDVSLVLTAADLETL